MLTSDQVWTRPHLKSSHNPRSTASQDSGDFSQRAHLSPEVRVQIWYQTPWKGACIFPPPPDRRCAAADKVRLSHSAAGRWNFSFKLLLTAASAHANVTAAVIIVRFWRVERTPLMLVGWQERGFTVQTALISSYGGLNVRAVLTRTAEIEERDIHERKCPRTSSLKFVIFIIAPNPCWAFLSACLGVYDETVLVSGWCDCCWCPYWKAKLLSKCCW